MGQVHKGKLVSGEEIAIKVQKPNIKESFNHEIKIMKFMTSKTECLGEIISEFERVVSKELDYTVEMINMQYLAHNFRKDNNIHIPKIYSQYCSEKLLVMEFIPGEELSNVILSEDLKYDKFLIAQRVMESYFKQVFLDGFFHADPHSGNILVMENNMVCFIDRAIIGHLNENSRKDFAQLLITLDSRNTENIINYINIITEEVSNKLINDINDLINRKYDDILILNFIKLLIKHNIKISKEYINIARGLAIIQRNGIELNPKLILKMN